jgi:hypothetical protein
MATRLSIKELNQRLDPEEVLAACGVRATSEIGSEVRAFCPVHGSDHQPSLAVRRGDNVGMCHNTGCPAHEGGSLLWIYSLVVSVSLAEAAQHWADRLGVNLKRGEETPSVSEMDCVQWGWRDQRGRFQRTVQRVTQAGPDPESEVYRSIFRYSIADRKRLRAAIRSGQAYLYGPFFADFDNPWVKTSTCLAGTPFEEVDSFEEGVGRARKDLVVAIEVLRSRGIPEPAIATSFSGCGFHLEVDPMAFSLRPSQVLHQVWFELACEVAGIQRATSRIALAWDQEHARPNKRAHPAGLQTLDQQVYTSDRLWRLENTRNAKSGYFKVRLGLDQAHNMQVEEILQFAGGPKPRNRKEAISALSGPGARRWLAEVWRKRQKAGPPVSTC